MTRFFSRLILPSAFIFTLVILLSGLAGHFRPPMFLSTFMTNPDGTTCNRPCLFGIHPGETNLDQAKLILASHPLTRGGQWLTKDLYKLTGEDYINYSLTPDRVIDSI